MKKNLNLSFNNDNFRTEGSLQPAELRRFQARTESMSVEEYQQAGEREIGETSSARKLRFKWGHSLPRKKVETAPYFQELTGPGVSTFHFSELSAATNSFGFECKIRSCGYADMYKG